MTLETKFGACLRRNFQIELTGEERLTLNMSGTTPWAEILDSKKKASWAPVSSSPSFLTVDIRYSCCAFSNCEPQKAFSLPPRQGLGWQIQTLTGRGRQCSPAKRASEVHTPWRMYNHPKHSVLTETLIRCCLVIKEIKVTVFVRDCDIILQFSLKSCAQTIELQTKSTLRQNPCEKSRCDGAHL